MTVARATSKKFRIKHEKFEDIMSELPLLFEQQYEEVVTDKDGLRDNVDYARYVELEKLRALHCTTVRHKKKLVGYFFNMIVYSLHTKGVRTSISDMIYLLPEYRHGTGLGLKLLSFGIKEMKKNGVSKMYVSAKEGTGLNKVLKHFRFRHIENGYSLWLGA